MRYRNLESKFMNKQNMIKNIISIAIIFVMTCNFFFVIISLSNDELKENSRYNKAVKIEDAEQFKYCMETNVGEAFAYGTLKAVDAVTFPELKLEEVKSSKEEPFGDTQKEQKEQEDIKFIYIKKVEEKYTMHMMPVTNTDADGRTYTTMQQCWQWDTVDTQEKMSSQVSFLGVTFDTDKIKMPKEIFQKTEYDDSGNVRYNYYGVRDSLKGTLCTTLCDSTIADDSPFYKGMTIKETVDMLKSDTSYIFLLGIIYTAATVFIVWIQRDVMKK